MAAVNVVRARSPIGAPFAPAVSAFGQSVNALNAATGEALDLIVDLRRDLQMRELGRALDETFLRGVAAASLQRFTDRLASDITQRSAGRSLN